tara:strand:- start:367 stop:516 length:150 start_codon:yes stop_codon:yes gene_type:complete
MDDRGPNDLEKIIEDKDKIITDLKRDNKALANQINDLQKQKQELLDKRS